MDDVILNVLPRYEVSVIEPETYDADIARIKRAFQTDSAAQRDKLISALREAYFVMAQDASQGHSHSVRPAQAYIRTERLSKLFDGIEGVFLVDDRFKCLRGEEIRELLEASGATRYLAPLPVSARLTSKERAELRAQAGCSRMTSEGPSEDYVLRGLDALLESFPKLAPEEAKERARLLWDGLRELLERRGQAVFRASYRWTFYRRYSVDTDADFIRSLNKKAWIPTEAGKLVLPLDVDFGTLGWAANPILETKVRFKPPVVELLAREAGIDPAILSLLKQHGLTDLEALLERLELPDNELPADETSSDEPDPAGKEFAHAADDDDDGDEEESDIAEPETESTKRVTIEDSGGQSDGTEPDESEGTGRKPRSSSHREDTNRDETATGKDKSPSRSSLSKQSSKATQGQSRFVSYVAVEPDDDADDPDGLSSEERYALEEEAIALILERESTLERTPPGNKGFDLLENDSGGEPERWIEVKAMKGTLASRPVGMSSAQFEFARKTGEQYWLYIVESAGERESARIVKIQNPAHRAGYFTFDHGWVAAAELDDCRTSS